METLTVRSMREFVDAVDAVSAGDRRYFVWFRGEPPSKTPLLPRLWRAQHIEGNLLQTFRLKAPTFAPGLTPDRENIDQWLFLAQHFRLPTRLLDWTESALAALFFALQTPEDIDPPLVWVLDPLRLNALSDPQGRRMFPLTWGPNDNPIAVRNIALAWGAPDPKDPTLPVAVQPTHSHARMTVQRSGFTVHGSDRRSLLEQVGSWVDDPPLLARIEVRFATSRLLSLRLLRRLGVSNETLFPDLEGLAADLSLIY